MVLAGAVEIPDAAGAETAVGAETAAGAVPAAGAAPADEIAGVTTSITGSGFLKGSSQRCSSCPAPMPPISCR